MKLHINVRLWGLELLLLVSLASGPLATLPLPLAYADAAGDALMARVADQRQFQNTVQTLSLTHQDERGRSRRYRLELRVRQDAGERSTYIRVLSPAALEGAQYLWLERPGQPVERYRLLPGRREVQRLTAASADGVLDTDLLFSDLGPLRWEGATHRVVDDGTIEVDGRGVPVQVVESMPPTSRGVRFTRLLSYVGTDGVLRQVRYFKGELEVRRQTMIAIEEHGTLRLPTRWVMESPDRKSRTELQLERYHLNVPDTELPDSAFTPEYLHQVGKAASSSLPPRG